MFVRQKIEPIFEKQSESKNITIYKMTEVKPTYLAIKNAHPRDAAIQFEEDTHTYIINGDRTFTSVTTWNHCHFPKFDANKIINNIISGRKHKEDPTYKYYMMTALEIKAMWDANRDSAAGSGTNMHYDIECYYNQMEVHNDSIEYQYFQNFLKENPELNPYRTEWTIYNEDIKIAGSVDMVYVNPDGTLLIYDWKRCKEIVCENMYGSTAITPCIKHVPDTNFWHYTLQLNTYKAIIEEKYGMKVVGLCLVCLHPDNCNKNYQIIKVPVIEKEIMDLFEYRKETLVSNVIKAADKKKTMAAKKKYAKVDAETQTDCCQDDKNKKISSFFQPIKTAAMLSAKPLMIKLEDDL